MNKMADSEFGKEVGLIHKVIVTGRKVGANRRFWTTLADDEEKFRKVINVVNTYDVEVNYNRSLFDMIKGGNYSRVSSDINSDHFSIKKRGRHGIGIIFFDFNQKMSFKKIIAEMHKQNYRPAILEELLAFRETYPGADLQKEFPIIALGSVWNDEWGNNHFPFLVSDRYTKQCELLLWWYKEVSDADWYFAAVSK